LTTYHVSWTGVVRRKFATSGKPGDALYLLWSRYREELAPGLIAIDASGVATFPVHVEATIEAEDMQAAERTFRFMHEVYEPDGNVTVEEVRS
jgi:hypothetical protein